MLRKRIELAVIAILSLGIIGYGAIGFAIAGDRIARVEETLNTVVSHQNTLNSTFGDINIQLTALSGSAAFDSRQALALVDRSVANSELAAQTIRDDDAALRASERRLSDQRWLMLAGSSGLDRESTRIAHARRALAFARIIAADQILQGRFWHALYSGLADLASLNEQTSASDLVSARSTLARMKKDIDDAAEFTSAPGLPADLRALTADLQRFVADYQRQLDAQIAEDDAGAAAQRIAVSADVAAIGKHDIDRIGAEINEFFRPMIDNFNAEISAATA